MTWGQILRRSMEVIWEASPHRTLGKRAEGISSFVAQYLKPTISLFLSTEWHLPPHPCSDCCGHPGCLVFCAFVWSLSGFSVLLMTHCWTFLECLSRCLCSYHSPRQPEERLGSGHWLLIGQADFLASECSLRQELSCPLVDTKAQLSPQVKKSSSLFLGQILVTMALEHRFSVSQVPCFNEVTIPWSFYSNRKRKSYISTLVDTSSRWL